MSRIWFYNVPFHGHVNPTLPLMQELVRRGEQVTYFSSSAFQDRIQACGASFRQYDAVDVFEQSRDATHVIQLGVQVARATYALLPEVLSAVERERPDYLMFDMSAPWGGIASRQFGIPSVASFPHLPFFWRAVFMDRRILWKALQNVRPGYGYWRELQRQIATIARDFKLRNPRDINVLSSSAELNIVFSSRYFQPYESHFNGSYVYVGPDIQLHRSEAPIQISRHADQKLIYIAVGTVYAANLEFLRSCLRAFTGDRYQVIMSTGKAIDPALLDPIPHNFTIAQYVPQLAVLRQADVFITHGGMSSLSEAIMLHVPMIVTPNTIEQSINAAALERLNAGMYLEPGIQTADTLRAAVEKIFSDPSWSAGIDRLRQSFLDAGGVNRAADAIQLLKDNYE